MIRTTKYTYHNTRTIEDKLNAIKTLWSHVDVNIWIHGTWVDTAGNLVFLNSRPARVTHVGGDVTAMVDGTPTVVYPTKGGGCECSFSFDENGIKP